MRCALCIPHSTPNLCINLPEKLLLASTLRSPLTSAKMSNLCYRLFWILIQIKDQTLIKSWSTQSSEIEFRSYWMRMTSRMSSPTQSFTTKMCSTNSKLFRLSKRQSKNKKISKLPTTQPRLWLRKWSRWNSMTTSPKSQELTSKYSMACSWIMWTT